ncbi:hypothetical protein [Geopseudomonas aromaticivorans]
MLKKTMLALAVGLTLSGCLSVPQGKKGEDYKESMAEIDALRAESERSQKNQRIQIKDGPLITGKRIPLKRYPWLTDKRVNLKLDRPISAHEVVRMLHDQGLNITSVMPLSNFTYAGYGFNNTDAETALRLIFPAMGLDYSVDNERKIITIVPMRSRTWTLNITPQKNSSYTSSSMAGSLDAGASLAESINSASGAESSTSSDTSSTSGGRQGDSKIESKSDFWASLKAELESRVVVLTPINNGTVVGGAMPSGGMGMAPPGGGMPNLPISGIPVTAATGDPDATVYREQRMGRVAVNPDTGSITVQGPHWLLSEIDEYVSQVNREFNTSIHFEGRLILVSTTRDKSEGLDLTAFASFANGELGMLIGNNPAGGITISGLGSTTPGAPPTVSTGADIVGSTKLAFTKLTGNPANLFINYLDQIGDTRVIQRPVISTTSGTPAEVSRVEYDLLSQISQESVSGSEGGAAVATKNTQIPIRFGTLLRVNPKISLETGLIRTQITLNVAVPSTTKRIEQFLTDAQGGTTTVPSTVTLPSNIDYNGEALLRDGDTVIIGGQVEEADQGSGSGITGYDKAGPLAGLIGSTKKTNKVNTYYLVLTAKVYERM